MKSLKEIGILPRQQILKNRGTGKEAVFLLRTFKKGDEEGMMKCVNDEYGDSYFKPLFYDKNRIVQNALGSHYDFFVAETDGQIAGMEIFTYFQTEGADYIEPASQILRREFRGYGLSKALVDYTFLVLEKLSPSAIFVHAVTFHEYTQRTCEGKGMVPVGFRLGSFLTEKMKNSYPRGRCEKYSEGILIKPVKKKDAGVVWLPEELRSFGEKIYRRLGVSYRLETTAECKEDSHREKGEYAIVADEKQRFTQVRIISHGKDLKDRMRELVYSYQKEGCWAIQIVLNCKNPIVVKEYEELKEIGFFFTGLKPLCGDCEQFYMQWLDEWKLCMEDYVLTESFQEIREDIAGFYRKRKIL